ncbi:MAG: hypothetical protein RI826_00935 [Chlorobium phaeovibrioides]|nr:hypothetical protein [Chlorobium phaeovibrioides]
MMEHSTAIFRRFWRFVEILIFFAISVCGFALIGKTSSLCSKTKEKSRTHAAALSQSSVESTAALYIKSNTTFLQRIASRESLHATADTRTALHCLQSLHLLPQSTKEAYAAELKTQLSHGAILRPRSLFQQSPVLLI